MSLPLPLVSIIIPVFNGSNYMREAIDSALAQTYLNREVIVVNDGSTDGGLTEQIALSYGDRIRYFAKTNGGVASALNTGIEQMRGDYFSWLSHDDLYVPHKLAHQIAFLAAIDQRDVVLYSDYICVDSQNVDQYEVRMDHVLLTKKPLYAVFRGALHGCTMLIPRKAFNDVGMFNLLPTTQDYDMWDRLIRRYAFIHMPNIFVRSRLHPEQTSRSIAATEEANALWIRLMSKLTQEELARLHPTAQEFFLGMANFFQETGYDEALNYALAQAKKYGSATASPSVQSLSLKHKSALKRVLLKMGLFACAVEAKDFLWRVLRFISHNGYSLAAWQYLFQRFFFAVGIKARLPKLFNSQPTASNARRSPPLVSVIIPSYNRAHTLPAALESLSAQSYENIEIIVVDDASSDATTELCNHFAAQREGAFRYLRNEVNIGASASRNKGIEVAQGEYITFLDSDDIYLPEKISKQIDALCSDPDARLCFSFYTTTYDVKTDRGEHLAGWPARANWYPDFLDPKFTWFVTPAIMIRKNVLQECGGFEPSMHCCEDIDLWARILQHHKAVLVQEPLVRIGLRHEQPRPVEWLRGRHQLYTRLVNRDTSITHEAICGWYEYLVDMYSFGLKEPSPGLLAVFTRASAMIQLPLNDMQTALTELLQGNR